MSDKISNAHIVSQFLEKKAVDFGAVSDVIKELGPVLSGANVGPKLVLVGNHFILACMLPAAELAGLVGELKSLEVGQTLNK
jgi:hypothetical protein